MARNYGVESIPTEDQRVEDDYIDELIRKYLNNEDMNSFYEDTSIPSLTSPETDKWLGEVLPPDFNNNQDFSVPELFMLEDVSSLPDMFDDTGSDEEMLSILDEIIMKDEKKTEAKVVVSGEVKHVQTTPKLERKRHAKALNGDPTSQNMKKIQRTSVDRRVQPTCRRPIIMKSRTKRRNVEE